MEVHVTRDAVLFSEELWLQSPSVNIVTRVLANQGYRVFKRSEVISELIFDQIGVLFRFSEISKKIHSLVIWFAVSPCADQPKQPFIGSLTINGQKLIRPVLLRTVVTRGEFCFYPRPEPIAIAGNISVRLLPKFEYVAAVDIGWQDFSID